MQCELCGKNIVKAVKVRIEGSVVTACSECAQYGEIVKEVDIERQKKKKQKKEKKKRKQKPKTYDFKLNITEELVDGYGRLVKKTRQEKDMKQEELGDKINEPASLIKKIEAEKLEPDKSIIRKIEKVLDLRLTEEIKRQEMNKQDASEDEGFTLGDVVVVREKNK